MIATSEITLLIAAIALFVFEAAFANFKYKKLTITASCFIILLICIGLLIFKLNSKEAVYAFNGLYVSNFYVNFFKLVLLSVTLILFLLLLGYERNSKSFFKTEFLIFIFIALLAGFIMLSANDLIPFYLGLELLFICVYTLIAFDKTDEKYVIQYFLQNLFFSSLILYGIVLLYGALGTTNFSVLVKKATSNKGSPIVILGVGLFAIGFICKLFDIYGKSVYKRISLLVLMFLFVITKLIMLLALLKLFIVDLGALNLVNIYLKGWT